MQPISQNYRTMSYRNKLKIGEFSRLMQVTVKTLRHYEHKGLLIPDEIDEWTGYRYYNIEQMQKLSRIREMQRLGFSLDEIRDLFEDDSHTPTQEQLEEKIGKTEQMLRELTLLRRPRLDSISQKGDDKPISDKKAKKNER